MHFLSLARSVRLSVSLSPSAAVPVCYYVNFPAIKRRVAHTRAHTHSPLRFDNPRLPGGIAESTQRRRRHRRPFRSAAVVEGHLHRRRAFATRFSVASPDFRVAAKRNCIFLSIFF